MPNPRPQTDMQRAARQRGQQFAMEILKEKNQSRIWAKLLDSKDERIVLDALKYLTDRAYGKAEQPNTHANANGEPFKIVYQVADD